MIPCVDQLHKDTAPDCSIYLTSPDASPSWPICLSAFAAKGKRITPRHVLRGNSSSRGQSTRRSLRTTQRCASDGSSRGRTFLRKIDLDAVPQELAAFSRRFPKNAPHLMYHVFLESHGIVQFQVQGHQSCILESDIPGTPLIPLSNCQTYLNISFFKCFTASIGMNIRRLPPKTLI